MSNTSDYNLANQVGSSFRAELNTVLGDVQSLNSGSSDPTTTVAYKIWVDTSTNLAGQKMSQRGEGTAWEGRRHVYFDFILKNLIRVDFILR